QKLYEAGHISYMRTDSTFLSNQALEEIEKTVKAKFGADHYKRQTYSSKSKNAQEAHEAIRPTHFNITAAGRNPQEEKLYQLIWQRAIASQMADAKVLKTKVTATAQDASIPAFATNGSRVLFEGWLKADPRARGEDVDLPKLAIGEKLDLADISHEGKETQPPSRYSEAGLVKELEKRGIGRPSTYASIIKTIQDRDYVAKENKSLRPTETGEVVSDFLSEHFDKYISDDFTAFMEDQLDSIAEGSKDYVKALKEFYDPFKKEVKSKNDIPKITDLGPAPQGTVCPECGNSMIIKLSRGGKFYSCSRFPDCQGALTLDGKKLEGPKELDEMCPKCGKSHLVEREGRFGKFVACGNYPKCKFIKKDETGGKGGPNDTGVECPMCKSGNMVQKRGRFGPFYGCSNYPDCKNIIKTKPTGNACPMCSALMMEGTKTIPERCSNKFCPMHNPHKLAKTEGKE
ncbi:MAG TPA: DNA topoisomerase, partial [Candidatus Paceibacterota bacterium]|nr:DNA topoisomerase [Candidatus Paceibacterota bacterium]